MQHLCDYVCGWDGFTEADLLGPAVGSADAVAFTPELWSRVLRDHLHYFPPVAQAMVDTITEYLASKATTAKN